MKRISAAFLCGIAMCTLAATPASADDGMFSKIFGLPIKGASIATGMAVGVPVAIVRKSCSNTKEHTNKIAGDDAGMIKKGLASIVGLPMGIVTGTFAGSQAGFKNSLKCDKPFSKEQMSLDDLD